MWRRAARALRPPARSSSMPPISPPWRPAPISARQPRSRSAACPGLPRLARPKDKDGSKGSTSRPLQNKAINDAVAMLRSLAQLRGRNADWAEKAVRDAATLTADEARKEGRGRDLLPASLDDLLAQADGRKVTVGGAEHDVGDQGRHAPSTIEPDWRTTALLGDRFRSQRRLHPAADRRLRHPVSSSGTRARTCPGVIGAISLILALIALSTLPVSYARARPARARHRA